MPTAIGSHLTLYTGVPIDNSYEHTFTDTSLLSNFTHTRVPQNSAEDMYYIRPDKNSVRVQHTNMSINGINLYKCNYMSFINNNYEGKLFYCFITDVRYINDYTAEIDFEIDVMMTWLKHTNDNSGCTFEECFIEREHTNNDDIGEHILEEPINIGDYIYRKVANSNLTLNICVCVGGQYNDSTHKWAPYSTNVGTENGLYVCDGLTRYLFNSSGNRFDGDSANPFANVAQLMESFLNPDAGATQDILKAIYYYPVVSADIEVLRPNGLGNNFNYIPKNKKLYTYPYCCCEVNNYEGMSNTYAFELSDYISGIEGDVLCFRLRASKYDSNAGIYPIEYKQGDQNSSLIKSKYPVLSASSTEYNSYRANLLTQLPSDLTTNVGLPMVTGALVGGGIIGGVVGAGAGLIAYATKAFAGGEQSKLKGSTPIGATSGFLQAGLDTLQFGIYIKSIRTDYLRSIDDFFTKFGYKVNRLKVPSMTYSDDSTRGLLYKYIKTIGCAINGYAPATAMSKIQEIMDNGITFWSTKNVGDYT